MNVEVSQLDVGVRSELKAQTSDAIVLWPHPWKSSSLPRTITPRPNQSSKSRWVVTDPPSAVYAVGMHCTNIGVMRREQASSR